MVAGTLPVLRRVATLADLFRRNIYPTSKLSCPLARFASLTCNFISPSLSCSSPEDEDRNKSDPGHRRAHPGQVFLIPLFPRWQSLAVPTRRLLDQEKKVLWVFHLLQGGDNCWQQKQRGSAGNSAGSLSFVFSPGNLPLLPVQLGSPGLILRGRHFKTAGLVPVYPPEHLFPLTP